MPDSPSPIIAIDVMPDGTSRPVDETWPAPHPAPNATWRWLHFERTDPALPGWLAATLPQEARAALLEAETRPVFDQIDEGLLLNLRVINLNPDQAQEDMVSIRLWVTSDLIVSSRYRRTYAVDSIIEAMKSGRSPHTTANFVTRLVERITERIGLVTSERVDMLDEIEETMMDAGLKGSGSDDVVLARIALAAIKLRRYIAPQREALARFASSDGHILGKADRSMLRECANRTARAIEDLDALRDRLSSLRLLLDSINAGRIGRNGFVLSIVAAIFLPLSFLTGLFGVNLAGMPGAHWPYAFAALSLAALLIGILLWLFFRWKEWF